MLRLGLDDGSAFFAVLTDRPAKRARYDDQVEVSFAKQYGKPHHHFEQQAAAYGFSLGAEEEEGEQKRVILNVLERWVPVSYFSTTLRFPPPPCDWH